MWCPREEVGNKAAVFRTPWVPRARGFCPLHLGICERRKRKGVRNLIRCGRPMISNWDTSLTSLLSLWSRYYYSCFKDENPQIWVSKRLHNLAKITNLIHSRVRTWTQTTVFSQWHKNTKGKKINKCWFGGKIIFSLTVKRAGTSASLMPSGAYYSQW